jgi:diketogulonate reductase-like aldo/keto reductase
MGIRPSEMAECYASATATGYRLVDTAQIYGNEEALGAAIATGAVPRDELFVTTKVGFREHGYDEIIEAVDESLARLQLESVDLVLIHWPLPMLDRYVDAWKALIEVRLRGKARSIGVSNFQQGHIERLISEAGVAPVVNQVELHPRFPQRELRHFHAEHGIITQAWSPLERGGFLEQSSMAARRLLEEPAIVDIAAGLGRSPAQVVLRWSLQLGNSVVPKAATPTHLQENLDLWQFTLTSADMAQIDTLELGRLGPDPSTYSAG